jgi:hypothetical protein
MPRNCYHTTIVKCHSNRPVSVDTSKMVETSKMAEILFSDADFTVP